MEVYTLGSMVPIGGGSSGLVKLRSGWVGRTQAVGIVRPLPAWGSSTTDAAATAAPGTGPTPGTWSPGGAAEPGRRGAACCGGGCCWRRGLVEVSEVIAEEEEVRTEGKKVERNVWRMKRDEMRRGRIKEGGRREDKTSN